MTDDANKLVPVSGEYIVFAIYRSVEAGEIDQLMKKVSSRGVKVYMDPSDVDELRDFIKNSAPVKKSFANARSSGTPVPEC